MCGIAGKVNLHGRSVDREQLAQMISTLRHRGPDAVGIRIEKSVGLAHARLSIIDLAGGQQPMPYDDGRFWITFNGEIFNFLELREELIAKGQRFATRSDTEVILAAYREYGEECVQHFNGQWAFAIWDEARQRLFLSRDRMGVRPLFHAKTDQAFLFASEMKALLASGELSAEVDPFALDQIFTLWVTIPPRTIFREIRQLPPGHSMVVENGVVRTWQYWKLNYENGEDDDAAEKRLSEELLALLVDATRLRLRSDVPVGAYLSGGIDSTFITALAKSLVGDQLRTFSVSFADEEFDETGYQQEATAFLNTRHTDWHCRAEDIAAVFPDVVRHTEQPIIRTAPAPLYLLSRSVRDKGFKVVLTGEGADEVLGGYDIFKEAKIRRFWGKRLDSRLRPLLLTRLYPYMNGIQRQSPTYLKSFFRVNSEDLKSPFFSHLPRWQLGAKQKIFYSSEMRLALESYDALDDLAQRIPPQFSNWNSFSQAEYLEASYLLSGYILSSQGDRMAMAHSVEGRYPFLDYRVVEFASRLSPRMKMKVLDQKHLLKMSASGLIPESIRRRPKQPYRAPDGKCFLGNPETPDYVNELLSPECLKQFGLFDSAAVGALANKFRRGQAIGVKDNMALVGILSTQLLAQSFATQYSRSRDAN